MEYPVDVDLKRLEEARNKEPFDWWNYTKFEGKWFFREPDRNVIQNRLI